MDREKIETCIRQLEEELLVRPDDPVLLNNLGANHSMLGDHSRAIEFYDRALTKSGDYRLARNNRCIALLAIGNEYADKDELDEASRYYESAVLDADGDLLADLHYNRGIVQFRQRDWQGAMQSFNTSRTHCNGNDRDTLINLGAAKSEIGNQHWALEDYREARIMGDDEDLYNNMGVSHARLSETEDTERSLSEAISYFKRSLTLNPDLDIAVENLRVCEGEHELYRQSLAENPGDRKEEPSDQALEPDKVSDEEIEKFLDELGDIPADPYRLLKVAERFFRNRERESRFWDRDAVQYYSNAVPMLLDTILIPGVKEHPLLGKHLRPGPGNHSDFAYHTDYLIRIINDKSLTEIHLGKSHLKFADKDRIQRLVDLIRATSSTGGSRPLAHGNPEDQPVIPDKTRRIVLGALAYQDEDEGILEILFDLTRGTDR